MSRTGRITGRNRIWTESHLDRSLRAGDGAKGSSAGVPTRSLDTGKRLRFAHCLEIRLGDYRALHILNPTPLFFRSMSRLSSRHLSIAIKSGAVAT